ncbi:MAG: acetate--CoA ligase family protein [Elusimicrobiota bacterium]|jgi:acyl-CoA synthetase (NDP forming)|nr:acetate--CoA ligase family protein [Elusimicrobiota bacterium]
MDFINDIFLQAHKNGQTTLTESECYQIFQGLGLRTPEFKIIPPSQDIAALLPRLAGDKIVIKILSSKTLHKTDKGGVKVCVKAEAAQVFKKMAADFPEIDSFMLVEFADYPHFALGREILLGARADKAFGPLITIGIGGTDAENITKKFRDGITPAITPAQNIDAKSFIENSFVWQYTAGNVRGGKKSAEFDDMQNWVQKLAQVMLRFSANAEFIIDELEINPLAAVNGRLCALDGVLRFHKNDGAQNTKIKSTATGIKALLEPKTAAVAGVSADKINMGRIIMRNALEAGFDKNNLYILKKEGGEIDGVKCYQSCKDFPKKVDMFVVTVPAAAVPDVLKDAGESGKINGLVLISGGIGEKEGSHEIRQKVEDMIIAAKKINPDFTLNGSNSLGAVSNPGKINTLFIPKDKLTPPLGGTGNYAPCAFISQSGAFVISALGKMEHIKPLYCVTTGNQLDISVPDFADYLAADDKVKVILLYIEGLKEGEGALLAQAVTKARANGKNVVIYMAGRTPSGQKAVMGHTASIAGDYITAKQIIGGAGAFMADTFGEFEAFAQMACSYSGMKPRNNKVFTISNAGFETSGMADNVREGGPLALAYPSPELKEKLGIILKKYKLDGIVDVRNPFDVTPMCPDEAALEIAQTVFKSGEYGSFIFSTIPLSPVIKTLEADKPDFMPKLAALSRQYGVPAVVSVSSGSRFAYYRQTALDAGLAVFMEADNAVRKLSAFLAKTV